MLCSRTRLSLSPSTTCLRLLFDQTVLWIAQAIEAAGIGIIVLGGVAATALCVRRLSRTEGFAGSYHRSRETLGRAILLGLEFLVAADIIGTVAVAPTFRNLGGLGLIVLIRTFLSFSLELEVNGRRPWQEAKPEGGAQATATVPLSTAGVHKGRRSSPPGGGRRELAVALG